MEIALSSNVVELTPEETQELFSRLEDCGMSTIIDRVRATGSLRDSDKQAVLDVLTRWLDEPTLQTFTVGLFSLRDELMRDLGLLGLPPFGNQ